MSAESIDPAASVLVDGRPTTRPCSWCASDIHILRRPGRPRLYCNHGCRQRAYEHRHGFCHVRTMRLLPGQHDAGPPPRSGGYESGGHGLGRTSIHALRTSVRPEGRRRETLCGLLAAPSGRPFTSVHPKACLTCSAVADSVPLRRPVEPSNELARLRAIIDETVERRLRPADAVGWLLTNGRSA
jgi:hypothetical protein